MSAWIVSRHHIHQLVTAIDTYVCPTEEPTALGQLLWNECIASVKYRYNDEPLKDLPGPIDETYLYFYIKPQRQLTPVEVYKSAACFSYQSCEHEGWEASEAYAYIEQLLWKIEQQLGKTAEQISDSKEYDVADWGIDDDMVREVAPIEPPKPVRHINLVDTAKLVRKALKAAWPTVKFSVRTDRYSMGCSIKVHWTDGPITSDVQALLDRFDRKSFDGMTDSTSYHTQEYEGEVVSFGADYVTGSRELSTAFLRQIACKVATQYQVAVPEVYNWAADEGKDHDSIRSTPESQVRIPNAPPFWREETVADVIYFVARNTSALPKPRLRIAAVARQID